MVIAPAKKKLREAAFFLAHLEQEAASRSQPRPEAGDFFLSAFLSAARSVTFSLEAAAPDVYPAWSASWRASRTEEERRPLSTFTEARNRALKRQTPSVQRSWGSLERERHPFSELPAEYFFFFEGALHLTEGATILARLTPTSELRELLPVCREYLRLLAALLAEFPVAPSGNAAA